MSVAEPTPASEAAEPPATPGRSFGKRVMHVVRRGHLYLGLFLLPWAILYGCTGFLFNHPEAFPDAPTANFNRSQLVGTPMESVHPPAETAQQVVSALRTRSNPPANYELVQPEKAKYTREFAFATVKLEGREVNVLIEANGNSGTVRSRAVPQMPPATTEKAPFAIGGAGAKGGRAPMGEKGARPAGERGPRAGAASDTLVMESPLHERVKATVPTILERTGFPTGEVTVTSVPDLSFQMSDGTKTWNVTYNAQTGAVNGKPTEDVPPPEELSTRRFLTRLHTTHVYPNEQNVKWYWTIIVDVMAFVMVFWGVSGLFMWWQLKATRKLGFVILALSLIATTVLGIGMHDFLNSGAR